MTPAERAQRDADKVFHWIRLNGAAAAPKPAAAPAVVAAPKPAVKSVAAAAPKPAPLAKAEADAAPVVAAAPVATPAAPPQQQQQVLVASAAPTMAAPPSPLPPTPQPAEPAPMPDLPLKLIHRVEPEISRQLMATMRSGSVTIAFLVQPDGSVQRAEARPPANRKLAAAAIDAVSQWRFEPIAKAREATVELGFTLE